MSDAEGVFSADYAELYDLLHHDKPYSAEVDLVLREARGHGLRPRSSIDLACGTGRHLAEMIKHVGFVHGNDLSPSMIKQAERRLKGESPEKARFSVAPMQAVEAHPPEGDRFDLATLFYTAMGYLVEADALDQLFRNLNRLLSPGALVFGDVWNGQRMAHEFSPSRERAAENERLRVRRVSNVSHVPSANALRVAFEMSVTHKQTGQQHTFRETHLVRYHFVPEVKNLLVAHGFRPVSFGPFFDEATQPHEAWNFYFLAQRGPP